MPPPSDLTGWGRLTMVRAVSAGGGRRGWLRVHPMSESGPPDPLRRLGEEIDKARTRAGKEGQPAGGGDITSGRSGLGLGLRIAIELVAALIAGVGLGWLADRYIGTRPWGLVIGFLLGSAAGMMNVYRVVQGMAGRPPGGE
jgi:ATP synthase protein I